MNQHIIHRFTVFTPTFNRAHLLHRVYESLKRQTFRDFEWLIVDDGSTDGTRELIDTWQAEASFAIRYYWQKNQHKKVAFNRGVREARGELLVPADSDDELLPYALEKLDIHWRNIPDRESNCFSAVIGSCSDPNGTFLGDKLPSDICDSNNLEIFFRSKSRGEKCGFYRTDVLRSFPFPENVTGLVPECVVWFAIGRKYKTRFVNDVFRVYFVETDSITKTASPLIGRNNNADGLTLMAREVLTHDWKWMRFDPLWFLKLAANYTRFHLHLQTCQPGKKWPLSGAVPQMMVLLMWPVGYVMYLIDKKSQASQNP